MPAITSRANNFLFNTDYPLDKVIYLNSGSTTIAAGGTVNIAHGLPFIPLINFYWSLTADFSVIYEANVGPFPSGNPGFAFSLQLLAQADTTNITFTANGVAGATNVYYRIFGFQPDDSNVDLPPTASAGDDFSFSTDYNYLKLFSASHFTLTTGTNSAVIHNLGYRPQITCWALQGGISTPLAYSSPDDYQAEVTATSVTFSNQTGIDADIYYRIYRDQTA